VNTVNNTAKHASVGTELICKSYLFTPVETPANKETNDPTSNMNTQRYYTANERNANKSCVEQNYHAHTPLFQSVVHTLYSKPYSKSITNRNVVEFKFQQRCKMTSDHDLRCSLYYGSRQVVICAMLRQVRVSSDQTKLVCPALM